MKKKRGATTSKPKKEVKQRTPPVPKMKKFIQAGGGRRIDVLYSPLELQEMPLSQVKKIYSELRSVAVKRLKRQETSKYNKTASYMFYRNIFKTIKEMEEQAKGWDEKYQESSFLGQLYGGIIDAQKYLSGGGIQKEKEKNEKMLETLHEKGGGYEWLNKSNIESFGRFMDMLREKYDLKRNSLASDRAAQLYAVYSKTEKESDIKEMFLAWQENDKELEALMQKIAEPKKLSTEKLKSIVSQKEKKLQKKRKYGAKKRNRRK